MSPRFRPSLADIAADLCRVSYDRERSGACGDGLRRARCRSDDQAHRASATAIQRLGSRRAICCNSAPTPTEFVVEIENDGAAQLRFGDDRLGRRPEPETRIHCRLSRRQRRRGQHRRRSARACSHRRSAAGPAISACAIRCRPRAAWSRRPWKTCAARAGGLSHAGTRRHRSGLRRSDRTPSGGAAGVGDISLDRQLAHGVPHRGSQGGLPVDDAFEASMRRFVERYRMAGHDLEVDGPLLVSLEIDMHVCAKPAISAPTSSANCSKCSATASSPTAGSVCFIRTTSLSARRFISAHLSPRRRRCRRDVGAGRRFQRQGTARRQAAGRGRLEIGRLGNRRAATTIANFAEHGVFDLSVGGGK